MSISMIFIVVNTGVEFEGGCCMGVQTPHLEYEEDKRGNGGKQ
jgi:hypothetical protein